MGIHKGITAVNFVKCFSSTENFSVRFFCFEITILLSIIIKRKDIKSIVFNVLKDTLWKIILKAFKLLFIGNNVVLRILC